MYWSPGKIVLERTGTGPIELNMNPGRDWYVNGKQVFNTMNILELGEKFTIYDSSRVITLNAHVTISL